MRNDLQTSSTFVHEEHAEARPSWFTFRRLAWFLRRSNSVRVIEHTTDGFVLVRIEGVLGFTTEKAKWRYAYVAWTDQAAKRGYTLKLGDEWCERICLTPMPLVTGEGAPTPGYPSAPGPNSTEGLG